MLEELRVNIKALHQLFASEQRSPNQIAVLQKEDFDFVEKSQLVRIQVVFAWEDWVY